MRKTEKQCFPRDFRKSLKMRGDFLFQKIIRVDA